MKFNNYLETLKREEISAEVKAEIIRLYSLEQFEIGSWGSTICLENIDICYYDDPNAIVALRVIADSNFAEEFDEVIFKLCVDGDIELEELEVWFAMDNRNNWASLEYALNTELVLKLKEALL